MREDQFAIEILPEATFGVAPTWTSPAAGGVVSIDLAPTEPPAIADPSQRLGHNEEDEIVGLVAGVTVPLTRKAESYGTLPSTGSAPAHNLASRILETVFGRSAELLKRSTVKTATTPTTTEIIETTNDGHLSAGVQIVSVNVAAEGAAVYEEAPATYDAVTDKLTLLFELSAAPVAGSADIGGGINHRYLADPAAPPTIAMRAYGNADWQHTLLLGGVAKLEVPELGPATVPIFSTGIQIASATHDPSGWTRPTVDNPLGIIAAGSSVKIGKYGETSFHTPHTYRLAIGVRPGWVHLEDVPAQSGAAGVASLGGPAGYIEITVPRESDPSDVLGGDSCTWEQFWRSLRTGQRFHIQAILGTTSGRKIGFYLPKAMLMRPSRAAIQGQAAVKLRFVPAAFASSDSAAVKAQEMVCTQL